MRIDITVEKIMLGIDKVNKSELARQAATTHHSTHHLS